jgi:polyisoprenoid-binding protein YceI
LSLAVFAQGPAPRVLSLEAAQSKLSYAIVHKLHKVGGESKEIEGKVALLPDGKVQVMVRAPVTSFKSGDANRDEHMLEVLESVKYSHVTFKGVATLTPPAAFPATTDVSLAGQLEFHGRKRAETIALKVEWLSAGEAHVTGAFNVSLDAYEVERPSLLFMKIDDACAIGVDLKLKEEVK